MFCYVQEPYLLILANLQSNKWQDRNATIFPLIFRLHASLQTWNFPFLEKSWKFFTSFSFLDQSSCKCRFIWSSNCSEQELRDRCSWEKLVTVADFKRHPRQNTLAPRDFFDNFQRFFSFGVDPLNWQSFIEIGEMACSTTARCSRGHTLNASYAQSFTGNFMAWVLNKKGGCKSDENCLLICF